MAVWSAWSELDSVCSVKEQTDTEGFSLFLTSFGHCFVQVLPTSSFVFAEFEFQLEIQLYFCLICGVSMHVTPSHQ